MISWSTKRRRGKATHTYLFRKRFIQRSIKLPKFIYQHLIDYLWYFWDKTIFKHFIWGHLQQRGLKKMNSRHLFGIFCLMTHGLKGCVISARNRVYCQFSFIKPPNWLKQHIHKNVNVVLMRPKIQKNRAGQKFVIISVVTFFAQWVHRECWKCTCVWDCTLTRFSCVHVWFLNDDIIIHRLIYIY